jgi:predicted secreted hydrolase
MNATDRPLPQTPQPATQPITGYGERLKYRLNDMLTNPYSFLPSYAKRYDTLIRYATDTLTAHQAYAMTFLLGADAARHYRDMPCTGELQFPKVNAVDLGAQVGWYYLTGSCIGEDGKEYGILCMFFRYTLLPPPIAEHFGLSPSQNQIVDVQLSICSKGGTFYQIDPPVVSGVDDEVKVSDKLELVAGDNVFASVSDSPFPMRVKAAGTDMNGSRSVPTAIDLRLSPGGHYFVHGDDGAEPLIAGIGTRYYSIQNIELDAADAAQSTVTYEGKTVRLKSGKFWFDHQWGTGMVPTGLPRYASMRAAANLGAQNPGGWDFFLCNLEGGSSISVSSLHTAATLPFIHQTNPNAKPPTMTAPHTGKYMDPYGTLFNVSGIMRVTEWRMTNHNPNPAKYKNVPTWVPHRWEFECVEKVVPENLRHITSKCICDDAQALYFANGTQYVEAATHIYDSQGNIVGVGFDEAVGYVSPAANTISLAGMPVTHDMIKLFKTQLPSSWMKLVSFLYLLLPSTKSELKQLYACASIPRGPRPLNC